MPSKKRAPRKKRAKPTQEEQRPISEFLGDSVVLMLISPFLNLTDLIHLSRVSHAVHDAALCWPTLTALAEETLDQDHFAAVLTCSI